MIRNMIRNNIRNIIRKKCLWKNGNVIKYVNNKTLGIELLIVIYLNDEGNEHLCLQEAGRAVKRSFQLRISYFPTFAFSYLLYSCVFIFVCGFLMFSNDIIEMTSCNPSNDDVDVIESQALASPLNFR